MSEITNPHDRFFKEVLSRPETAADFLANYLPPDVAAALDLSALELIKDSFTDEELRQHFSDLLYSTRLKGGQPALVYLLFEHKSEPEKEVSLQLLRYKTRIWERLPRDETGLLPPVIPLVLYHGQKKWNAPAQFARLVAASENETIRRFVPQFEYHLVDLSEYDLETFKGEIILRVFLALLKYIFHEGLGERLPEIIAPLTRMMRQDALEYLRTILMYLSIAKRQISKEDLHMAIEQTFPESTGEVIAQFALDWIAEGEQKGEQKSAARISLRLLERRFGAISDDLREMISSLSTEQLERLSEDLLDFT
ncbi:MAG: Rpn family recombination-promoting nuclease/putative transposase, partial [Blastocatellia bacterium]